MRYPLYNFFKKHNLKPFMTTYLAYSHLMALAGFIYALFNSQHLFTIFVTSSIFHVIWGLGITAGSHRLWAHKSYQASTPLKIFLMLLSSGANQGSVYHWSRDHRLHHKFSDTLLDPHSIKRGFFFAHMGWLLQKKSDVLINEGSKLNLKDLDQDPVIQFQKRFNTPLAILMGFLVPSLVFYYQTQVNFFMCLCFAMIPYITELHATWCVNSICHMFGTRPWNKSIESRDNAFVAIITNGEGYHNWHHEYPSDWRASKDHWYMFNLTARFLEICSLFKLCKLKV